MKVFETVPRDWNFLRQNCYPPSKGPSFVLLGLEKLTSAFGLLGVFEGVGCIISTPIAGAIFDATDSFDPPFYMAAGFFILASVLGFLVQVIDKRQKLQK